MPAGGLDRKDQTFQVLASELLYPPPQYIAEALLPSLKPTFWAGALESHILGKWPDILKKYCVVQKSLS